MYWYPRTKYITNEYNVIHAKSIVIRLVSKHVYVYICVYTCIICYVGFRNMYVSVPTMRNKPTCIIVMLTTL